MLSNSLVFHTSGGISSSPAAFLFLIFLSTELRSPCVNCPCLMSIWLLIIFMIGSCVTFGSFPRKFLKMLFPQVYSFFLAVNFQLSFLGALPSAHFVYCLPCLSSTKSLILLIWFCMYSVCSFSHTFAKFIFCLLKFLGIDIGWVPPIACFFLTANVSHGTLGLALCLIGMNSAAASKWALTKFSYSSFRVGVSDISWNALDLFLSVNGYLSLISLLLIRD